MLRTKSTTIVFIFCVCFLAAQAQIAAAQALSFSEIADPLPVPAQFESTPSIHCPAFASSTHLRGRTKTITVETDGNWKKTIEKASENTTILLKDGVYQLDDYAITVPDRVTVRSASGDRHSVVIRGRGYRHNSEGFMIVGNHVTIADLSITGMRNHGIALKPAQGARMAPYIYNVHLYDIGTQHIKGNVPGTSAGMIACSLIGYTSDGAKGDYNGGIDLHGASNWTIRDNVIYNINGDGSGCEVDKDCGTYISGPAILVWNKASNTTVERNYILGSYRNIALGLGRGHSGGLIRNNIILQHKPGDAGIELQIASDLVVEGNIVVLGGGYPGAIEYRESGNLQIYNNRLTSIPHDRGNNNAVKLAGNQVDPSLRGSTRTIYTTIMNHIASLPGNNSASATK